MKFGFRGKVYSGIILMITLTASLLAFSVITIVSDALSTQYKDKGRSMVGNIASRSIEPILAMDLIVDRLIWALTRNLFFSMLSNTFFSFLALFVLVILFRVFMESINRQQAAGSSSTS